MTAEAALLGRALSGDRSWADTAEWDVTALAAAADDHGVAALVWQVTAGGDGRAAQLHDALAPRVRAAATRDLFIQRDMQIVLAALSAAGARTLVIKGSALAYTVYESPWLRPRTDTDLLVAHGDVPVAMRVLEGVGYARSDALTSGTLVSHQVTFERVDGHGVHHVVDLHWKIVNPQMLADALPFDDLWTAAQPAPALGVDARVPSAVASIALGSIHRLAHHQGHDRLVWLFDLRLLTAAFRDTDWDDLCRLAGERGIAGLCLDALRQSRDRLGCRMPSSCERTLEDAAPHEASRVYLQGTVHKRDVLINDLATLSDWRSRLRLLREHVFPPAAFIRQRYGHANRWPLPALYVHRLVTGALRWVRP